MSLLSHDSSEGDAGFASSDDDLGFHIDGGPTVRTLAVAVQCWSILQQRETTVGEAALAFNLPPEKIAEAVDWHYWMFVGPPEGEPRQIPLVELVIVHEGE